jgi:hypothetical protein
MKCSACGKDGDPKSDGVEVWDSWFCSICFISRARGLHRELKPEDIELFKVIAKDLAGLMPSDLLEMILAGFWRNATGRTDAPPREETLRTAAEIQRLTAFANFAQRLRLLKTWRDVMIEFVDDQEREIREQIKRLTEGE